MHKLINCCLLFICWQTEFMVDMSCEGCVKAVKNKLQTVDGGCLTSLASFSFMFLVSVHNLSCSHILALVVL